MISGRRRHYRRVFPIVVGAYMILSTVLIPLGFKFMTLLGTKSLLLSKLSLMISLMGGIKKVFGYGTEAIVHSYYTPTYYPTAAHPPAYPTYYDPWRRDEFRKISHYDEPAIDYSHFSEEIEQPLFAVESPVPQSYLLDLKCRQYVQHLPQANYLSVRSNRCLPYQNSPNLILSNLQIVYRNSEAMSTSTCYLFIRLNLPTSYVVYPVPTS